MIFEDEFSEKQTDMIQLALEYAERVHRDVDMVYIYASHENNLYSFNVFYTSGNEILTMRMLSETVLSNVKELIFDVLKLGTDDIKELETICQKYSQPMPTQIKLIYDNKNNRVKGRYSYEKFYSGSDTLTAADIFQQWFEEVKAETQ